MMKIYYNKNLLGIKIIFVNAIILKLLLSLVFLELFSQCWKWLKLLVVITKDNKLEILTYCVGTLCSKYVSNKRQKENKLCWLFESDKKSGSAELEESKLPLPPLDVPKFRWWQCRNCLHGVSEKEIGKSVLVNKLNGESNSDGPSCTHIALTRKETTVLVSEFKQILKLDNAAEKGEGNSDLLVRVSADESHGLLCSDQKEERDGRSDDTIKGKLSPRSVNLGILY